MAFDNEPRSRLDAGPVAPLSASDGFPEQKDTHLLIEVALLSERDRELLSTSSAVILDLLSFNEELPELYIVGNPAYQRHKFRGNWFQGVVDVAQLVADILQNDTLMTHATHLADRIRERGNTRTTREEIEEGNTLLNNAFKALVDRGFHSNKIDLAAK